MQPTVNLKEYDVRQNSVLTNQDDSSHDEDDVSRDEDDLTEEYMNSDDSMCAGDQEWDQDTKVLGDPEVTAIYTANHATFQIRIHKLQYRFAVTSGSTSIIQ